MKPRIYRDLKTKTIWVCESRGAWRREYSGRGSSPAKAYESWSSSRKEYILMVRKYRADERKRIKEWAIQQSEARLLTTAQRQRQSEENAYRQLLGAEWAARFERGDMPRSTEEALWQESQRRRDVNG